MVARIVNQRRTGRRKPYAMFCPFFSRDQRVSAFVVRWWSCSANNRALT
ncbi:hypothetical protein KCP70_07815 [Salmonella enterica subsp. enterica]|nr:hypothetical protein KCP70_07815 [Salmonella enterica subsp. enterica]